MCGQHYSYAYNGMEQDNEVSGNGNSYTTEFRQYDPRLARWKSVDPLAALAPGWNPYRMAFNNPILYTDELGLFEKDKAQRKVDRINKRKNGRSAKLVYGGEDKGYGVFVVNWKKKGVHYAAYFESGKPMNARGGQGATSIMYYDRSLFSTSEKKDVDFTYEYDEDGVATGVDVSYRGRYSSSTTNQGWMYSKTSWDFSNDKQATVSMQLSVPLEDIEPMGGAGGIEWLGGGPRKGKAAKWGWKSIKRMFTRKAVYTYSKQAKSAFKELGVFASHITYRNGVATLKIGFTKSVTKGNLAIAEEALRTNGATTAKILTGKVKGQYKNVLNYYSKNNKLYKGYKVQKSPNPLHDFKLTKKL